MAGLKIEGDLSHINDKQLSFIKSVIEKRGFKDNKVIIEPLGKAGDNYMANVKRIIVEDKNGRGLKMVVKIAPQSEVQRAFSNTEYVFRNEHIMYIKVLPKFSELEKTYDVPKEDRLRYPMCYGSFDEAPNELIILEDLTEAKFKMLSRFEPLNLGCVKSILKNFSLLHSLGFALKYKEPQVFDECRSDLFDVFSHVYKIPEISSMFKSMEMNVVSMLESDIHKKTIQGAVMEPVHNFERVSKFDLNSKQAIIQHGDSWTNNFLFNMEDGNIQSLIIDYQTAKAANPVIDVLFLLSSSTSYELRKEHFTELIDYYHDELDKSLSNFGLKSNFVYSRDQLDVDLKRYAKIIFGHTLFMVSMMALKPEEAILAKEAMANADTEVIAKQTGAAASKDPETLAMFKKSVEGIIDTYLENGLL